MSENEKPTNLKKFLEDEMKRQTNKENEISILRSNLEAREQELDAYRQRMREDQIVREKMWQKELESRESLFVDKERKLLERQREFEKQLEERQYEIERLRAHLTQEISVRESKLSQALTDLEKEKERYNEENRQRIERTSKNYVKEALDVLKDKEHQFHKMSKIWSGVGALSLIVGAGFFVYISVEAISVFSEEVTWELIAFSALKGLISVGLLVGLSRYGFLFGQAYMREALKNADRLHAINFGKFYLESYGAAADWSQIKEAFEHWNISSSNAFSSKEEEKFDKTTLERAVKVIEDAASSITKVRGKDT